MAVEGPARGHVVGVVSAGAHLDVYDAEERLTGPVDGDDEAVAARVAVVVADADLDGVLARLGVGMGA